MLLSPIIKSQILFGGATKPQAPKYTLWFQRTNFQQYAAVLYYPMPIQAATHGDFAEIPLLDLSLGDDDSTRQGLLNNLRTALTDVGFLYVSNHGVPQSTVAGLVEILPRLFELPHAAKEEIALENSPHFLGYSKPGSETTAGSADQREQVEFATELAETWTAGSPLYERLRGPNQVCERLEEASLLNSAC